MRRRDYLLLGIAFLLASCAGGTGVNRARDLVTRDSHYPFFRTGTDKERESPPPGLVKDEGIPPGLAKKDEGTPPGLAKKGGVPPGLAKKGGVPPGQAKTSVGEAASGSFTYRYYPRLQVYFDATRMLYFYLETDSWRASATMPVGMAVGSDESQVELELDTDEPYLKHADTVKKYPPGQAKKAGGKSKAKGKGKGKSGKN